VPRRFKNAIFKGVFFSFKVNLVISVIKTENRAYFSCSLHTSVHTITCGAA